MQVGWQQAWTAALYQPDGFYRRPEGPAGHFRTAVHAGAPTLARALAALARQAGCRAVLDLGAGRGELIIALAELGAGSGPGAGVAAGLTLHAVDVVDRPAGVPAWVGWTVADPARGDPLPPWPQSLYDDVLVVCWELLDVVPCPVLETDDDGLLRQVLVDPASGRESLGDPAGPQELAWTRRWWPIDGSGGGEPARRVEVGLPRDELWAAIAGRVRTGLLLAVDYAHRRDARPPAGTLSGFRGGRQVPPVPDGSCDLTAEVALDSARIAAQRVGAGPGVLLPQHAGLTALLGATAGPSECPRELLDPGGLGGFSWLLQPVRMPLPPVIVALAAVPPQ
jgi:SAM-dependent MidA family methyltransferase